METITVKSSKENSNVELHFNLWDSDKNKLHCLDIGIMCEVNSEPETIKMTIPGKYKKGDINDLSDLLISKNEICTNIFNCKMELTIQDSWGAKVCKKQNQKDEKFIIRKFDVESQNKNLLVNDDYIEIAFKVNEKSDIISEGYNKIYYRIRIGNFKLKSYSVLSKSKGGFFESSYDRNRIIDFRINDIKLLSLSTGKEIADNNLKISKIHFLYITDCEENIILATPEPRIRLFETENWKEYIKAQKHEMLAYHMFFKESTTSPSFLLKIQQRKTSAWHIGGYAIGVLLMSLFANLIMILFEKLSCSWSCISVVLFGLLCIIALLIFIPLINEKISVYRRGKKRKNRK